jgi:hypothetical protein
MSWLRPESLSDEPCMLLAVGLSHDEIPGVSHFGARRSFGLYLPITGILQIRNGLSEIGLFYLRLAAVLSSAFLSRRGPEAELANLATEQGKNSTAYRQTAASTSEGYV